MDSIVAPLHVTSTVPLLPNTPIVFKSGIPNHITVKTKNFKRDDHTGVLLGAHPGDGHPRYVGVLLEGITTIIAPLKDSEATVVLEEICLDYADAAFTLERGSSNPLLGRTLQREKAADDGNITIAIHVKRKIVSALAASTPPVSAPVSSSDDTMLLKAILNTSKVYLKNHAYYLKKVENEDYYKEWEGPNTPIVPTEAIPYVFASEAKGSEDQQDIKVYVKGDVTITNEQDTNNLPQKLSKGDEVRLQYNSVNNEPVWGDGPGGFLIGYLAQDYSINPIEGPTITLYTESSKKKQIKSTGTLRTTQPKKRQKKSKK